MDVQPSRSVIPNRIAKKDIIESKGLYPLEHSTVAQPEPCVLSGDSIRAILVGRLPSGDSVGGQILNMFIMDSQPILWRVG